MDRRASFFFLTASLLAVPWAAEAQTAEPYPQRPVRIVVPFAPGGATDVVARMLAQRMSERLGQPFIVDNKPGAANMLANDLVAKAKVVRAGSQYSTAEAYVYDSEGTLVASGRGTYFTAPPK